MLELLSHLFAFVCGQQPDHTWAPGGMLLPLCQRCTGLYTGAAVAAFLHVFAPPKPSSRLLELHGAFLLLMVPFGFHWIPQGPTLRTVTGVLFGFGVLMFLRMPLSFGSGATGLFPGDPTACRCKPRVYLAVLTVTATVVPWLGRYGGALAGYVLLTLCGVGALALAALILANIALGTAAAIRIGARLIRTRMPS